MRIGGDILGIIDTGAILVDPNLLAEELVLRCLIGSGIARIGFPEIGAVKEFEAGAREIDSFQ